MPTTVHCRQIIFSENLTSQLFLKIYHKQNVLQLVEISKIQRLPHIPGGTSYDCWVATPEQIEYTNMIAPTYSALSNTVQKEVCTLEKYCVIFSRLHRLQIYVLAGSNRWLEGRVFHIL